MPIRFIGQLIGGGYEISHLGMTNTSQLEWAILNFRDGEITINEYLDYLPSSSIRSIQSTGNYRYFLGWGFDRTMILKSNVSGEIIWTNLQYPLWNIPLFNSDDIALVEGNVIAIGGSYYNLHAIRLNQYGQVDVNDPINLSVTNSISASPNPMRDMLRIKTQSIHGKYNTITIYNIRGQLVTTLSSDNGTFYWDGRDKSGLPCTNGVYILKDLHTRSIAYISKID